MLPTKFRTETYSNFFRMPAGNYPTRILYHETCPFPYRRYEKDYGVVIQSKEEYSNLIIQASFAKFNNLNLGITFTIASNETVNTTGFHGLNTITVQPDIRSMAFSNQNGLNILLGMPTKHLSRELKPDISDAVSLVCHEMLHCMGFGHKSDGIMAHQRPAFHQGNTMDENSAMGKDDIHGLSVVYDSPCKYLIQGKLEDRSDYKNCEAYIVNVNGRLKYQTPVDVTGNFEFRLNEKFQNSKFHLLLIGEGLDELYYYNKFLEKSYSFKEKILLHIDRLSQKTKDIKKIPGIFLS